MIVKDTKNEWDAYVARERARVEPLLNEHGFSLDEYQPQTIGERYLTRPVGGGRKVVFFGHRNTDNMRVVIKTSNEEAGMEELEWERRARKLLDQIKFAYETFYSPEEISFAKRPDILITEYIEQDTTFLERSLQEQFDIILKAFKAQESAHATTSKHLSMLKQLMSTHHHHIQSGEYRKIGAYAQDIISSIPDDAPYYKKIEALTDRAISLVNTNYETLDRYDGFLTHWDFIPQNFRIRDDKLYLLDHTSIRFGNKYESWARFINFMELYNPPLARALVQYVRDNRAPEELLALKIMRVYRLVELIRYYATWLSKTEGSVKKLAEERIAFWSEVFQCVLDEKEVPISVVESYKQKRDNLRSDDEKERQRGLH
jgi:hypothetical protein